MPIKTIVITMSDYTLDKDVTVKINNILNLNNITSDNLVDIKFSNSDNRINVLIVYKEG